VAILILALLLGVPTGIAAAKDPPRKIMAMFLGDVIDQTGGYNTFTVIDYDPAIQATLIPSVPQFVGGYDNAYRNLRVYMPRTYERLVEEYQMMVFSDADRLVFKAEWIGWLSSSVTDHGLALLWLGSIEEETVLAGWDGTTVAEILPARQAPGQYTIQSFFYVRILDHSEPLMQALPWEKTPGLANVNAQIPKKGSEYWAKLTSVAGEYPLMTYWGIGEGTVLNFASKFPVGVQPWASNWHLFPQAMIYLAYRAAGKTLPDDPYIFQSVISAFIEFIETNSLLESMLAWVETFGGNPQKLRDRVRALEETKVRAEDTYLDGDIAGALAIMEEAKVEQSAVRVAASNAKDEALFWVYVVEWFALTGTFLISSYVLWALMVRRKLYKDVAVSRLEARIE
jgi:hypothetical protein